MGRGADTVGVLIPAYNEEPTIGGIIDGAKRYADIVMVVDDCSTDKTYEIVCSKTGWAIHRDKNMGSGPALQEGYEWLSRTCNTVIQLDADGQHSPDYIPDMLKILKDCDVVIGSRFLTDSYTAYPRVRRIGVRFFSWVCNTLTGTTVTDITSGYRAYRVQVLKKLPVIKRRHWAVEQTIHLGYMGARIKDIPMVMPVRGKGYSQFSLKRYVYYPLLMAWVVANIILRRGYASIYSRH